MDNNYTRDILNELKTIRVLLQQMNERDSMRGVPPEELARRAARRLQGR